jgi:hypothetical protein
MRALIVVISLLVCPMMVSAQSRAQQIASAFTKHKNALPKKYKDVRAEPVIRGDYTGRYEVSGLDWWIEIRVGAGGRIEGSGRDDRIFEVTHATIAGSMLTATKVYRDGSTEQLEGVFMNRIERTSPSDPGAASFGLGVLLNRPVEGPGGTFEKVFYQMQH